MKLYFFILKSILLCLRLGFRLTKPKLKKVLKYDIKIKTESIQYVGKGKGRSRNIMSILHNSFNITIIAINVIVVIKLSFPAIVLHLLVLTSFFIVATSLRLVLVTDNNE